MLTIDENKIFLTRGDTAYLSVAFEGYEYNEGDTITLTVRKTVDGAIVLEKTVPILNTIVLVPEDTKNLEYGKYLYDIEIDTVYGEVFTIIEKSQFVLKEEITRDE